MTPHTPTPDTPTTPPAAPTQPTTEPDTHGYSADPLWPVFIRTLRAKGFIGFMLVDQLPHIPGVVHPDDCGMVDRDTGLIYLNRSCTPGELRSTISHELLHLDQPHADEAAVEHANAKLLVPLAAALAARSRGDVAALARRLLVDPALVLARLEQAAQRHRAG